MNSRLAISTALGAAILCGCATTHPAPVAHSNSNSSCLTDTGSRLPAPQGSCKAYGRTYSQEDLERTGKTTAGGALGLLDPSLTVQH